MRHRRYSVKIVLGALVFLGGCGGSGGGSSNITTSPPTAITTQPASQTVTAGQTATFSVTASGTGTLTYQWSKNGKAIGGAMGSSYTTPATNSGAIQRGGK